MFEHLVLKMVHGCVSNIKMYQAVVNMILRNLIFFLKTSMRAIDMR